MTKLAAVFALAFLTIGCSDVAQEAGKLAAIADREYETTKQQALVAYQVKKVCLDIQPCIAKGGIPVTDACLSRDDAARNNIDPQVQLDLITKLCN